VPCLDGVLMSGEAITWESLRDEIVKKNFWAPNGSSSKLLEALLKEIDHQTVFKAIALQVADAEKGVIFSLKDIREIAERVGQKTKSSSLNTKICSATNENKKRFMGYVADGYHHQGIVLEKIQMATQDPLHFYLEVRSKYKELNDFLFKTDAMIEIWPFTITTIDGLASASLSVMFTSRRSSCDDANRQECERWEREHPQNPF